ncbi:hypothetical protein BHM03_00006087 [Ensete ventricosum]|nr:hypothetical protein BHM03_00006087 [Ensete ventricosum]
MGGVRLALATSTATPGGCSLLRLLLPMASPVKHFYLLLLRLRFPSRPSVVRAAVGDETGPPKRGPHRPCLRSPGAVLTETRKRKETRRPKNPS